MKIFIIGLPQSGRTTVAKAIAQQFSARYLDAMSWIRSTFRNQKEEEPPQRYEEEYHHFLSIKRMINPSFVSDYVFGFIRSHDEDDVFVIDGIASPRDFCQLFDYREDIIVFLNRIDNEVEYKDHENIGVSVIRDYCFWASSAGLINKHKWLEYNFRIPGEESDFVKELGSKNSVFVVRSFSKLISHLMESLAILMKKD